MNKTMNSKKAGFTLVELLVAMAIIVILIGLGIAGYTIARRMARNTMRDDIAKEMTLFLEDYQTKYNERPDTIKITAGDNTATFSVGGAQSEEYPLSKMVGITEATVVSSCEQCPEKLGNDQLTLIYSRDNSLLGACTEPNGEVMLEGECGATTE
jgi:prepilin-type N-terminal cleavage/methylation domain-containing protein